MTRQLKMIGLYIPEDEENGTPAVIKRGPTLQGYVFKDEAAFYQTPSKVCYIPEQSDDAYTGNDFRAMALGQLEIAEDIFLHSNWQSPEAYLEEQFRLGEWEACPACGRIFESYGAESCPYCNSRRKVQENE